MRRDRSTVNLRGKEKKSSPEWVKLWMKMICLAEKLSDFTSCPHQISFSVQCQRLSVIFMLLVIEVMATASLYGWEKLPLCKFMNMKSGQSPNLVFFLSNWDTGCTLNWRVLLPSSEERHPTLIINIKKHRRWGTALNPVTTLWEHTMQLKSARWWRKDSYLL